MILPVFKKINNAVFHVMKPIGGKIKLVDCEGCPLRVSKELIENSLGKVVFDIKKQHF